MSINVDIDLGAEPDADVDLAPPATVAAGSDHLDINLGTQPSVAIELDPVHGAVSTVTIGNLDVDVAPASAATSQDSTGLVTVDTDMPSVEIGVPGVDGKTGPPGADSTVPGPVGPTGPTGAPGTGGYDQTYFFNSASATWEVVHGQGSYALNVETLDINGQPFEGDVLYPDPDTIRINWFYPEVGVARVYR